MVACVRTWCCRSFLGMLAERRLSKDVVASCMNCNEICLPFGGGFYPKQNLSAAGKYIYNMGRNHADRVDTLLNSMSYTGPRCSRNQGWHSKSYSTSGMMSWCRQTSTVFRFQQEAPRAIAKKETLLQRSANQNVSICHRVTEASLSSVAPVFVVMRFDKEGNVTSFEKKKTELCQELSLQARDLRFQHSTSLTARNNCIIIRMESLKAVVTPQCLLVFDFRGLALERWLVLELAPQIASQTHSLPFEFRALEAILQHRVNSLQTRLNEVHPVILDTLESLVDPKILSADRSKLHILLQNSKSLSELETDIKVFKDSLLKILDEEEMIEELCLTKWTDPRVFEESSMGIDHAEEMELLLENYYMQAEELGNETRELKGLIDDSESVIFINLDSHRNVMMRLNLQLTMGTFSLSLFGLMGVAFGMNLESSFEECVFTYSRIFCQDPRVFWLVTGFMFLGSGLIWRRLLSFLGRHLEPSIPPVWKRNLKGIDTKTGVR